MKGKAIIFFLLLILMFYFYACLFINIELTIVQNQFIIDPHEEAAIHKAWMIGLASSFETCFMTFARIGLASIVDPL